VINREQDKQKGRLKSVFSVEISVTREKRKGKGAGCNENSPWPAYGDTLKLFTHCLLLSSFPFPMVF